MRMRRKPWARPELDAWKYYIQNPVEQFGAWHQEFHNTNPIHLELGCGKGVFTAKTAAENPDINYIAIDIKSEVLAIAKREIERERDQDKPCNVRIMSYDIERIPNILSPKDNIQRIYINFCNPWQKERHKKHRLTHTKQLALYTEFLQPKGEIWFKTDDTDLFKESLRYFAAAGFVVKECTYDLHKSDLPAQAYTEHEILFCSKGVPIKFLIAYKD